MSTLRTKSSRARLRRARHRRQEGIALLVIMIIIVITTAAAAASVRNTTAEMQAAGKERVLIQARYASEAALVSTLAYLDEVGDDFEKQWADGRDNHLPPETREFTGGHQILAGNRYRAIRTSQTQQAALDTGPLVEPVSRPNPTLPVPDLTGSFGPYQGYAMDPYIVDITDCAIASTTSDPENPVNQSASSSTPPRRVDCTLTVRGRISMVDALNNQVGTAVSWDLPGGLNGVVQERSGAGYDMRATIKTVPMQVQ